MNLCDLVICGLSHIWYNVAQGFDYFLMPDTLFDHDEDRVVASDGANDLGYVAVVDVPGDAAGIAGTGLDDTHVPGEVDADEAWHLHHLTDVARCTDSFVHRIVGQHIDVIPAHRGSLGDLQLFQVAAQSSLRQFESFFLQSVQQLVLTAKLLA